MPGEHVFDSERIDHLVSLRALAAVTALAKQQKSATVYWAVAEKEGLDHPLWHDFPKVWQGEGDLGRRLAHVYQALLERHQTVCFVGADSPHISADRLDQAMQLASEGGEFILGNCSDGGFYFFGGSLPLSENTFTQVEYSQPNTAKNLESALQEVTEVKKIALDFDIDLADDLKKYLAFPVDSPELLAEQKSLIHWVQRAAKEKK